MSQTESTLPHVNVRVTYKTKTPFLYVELSGTYQGRPINIAVIEAVAGQAETITGVSYNAVQPHDHDDRERPSEHRSREYWHAAIRTNRLNLAPLFNREPHPGTANNAAFKLTWTPDPDAVPNVRNCNPSDIIFGRLPELHPLKLGHDCD